MEAEETKLSNKQLLAVDLVLHGMNDQEVGERIGKSRQTVNRWCLHNMEFCSLLTKRRKEVREHHRDGLNDLVSEALQVVREAMKEDDISTRLQAALAVLRMSGLRRLMQAEPIPTKEEIAKEYILDAIRENMIRKGLEFPG